MDDYINELKAEAEASMLKTVEKLLIERTKCGCNDAVFWAKIIRDIDFVENKLKEERKEKNRLKKKLREADTFVSAMYELLTGDDDSTENLVGLYEGFVKEHRQLDRLKKFAMEIHNMSYGTEYNDTDIVSSFDFGGILPKMKRDENNWIDEVADLRKEVADLKKERTKYKHMVESVWTLLYQADKEMVNVNHDDIAGSVEYEENKDYIEEWNDE